jgi:hypothetical protein
MQVLGPVDPYPCVITHVPGLKRYIASNWIFPFRVNDINAFIFYVITT